MSAAMLTLLLSGCLLPNGGDTNRVSLASGKPLAQQFSFEWPGTDVLIEAPKGFCINRLHSKLSNAQGTLLMHPCVLEGNNALLLVSMIKNGKRVDSVLAEEHLGAEFKTLNVNDDVFHYATQSVPDGYAGKKELRSRLRSFGMRGNYFLLISIYAPPQSPYLGVQGVGALRNVIKNIQFFDSSGKSVL